MESKKDIRKRVLEKRSQMTQGEWDEKSSVIFERVVTHPFFVCCDTICCYVDFRYEVGTRKIIEEAWRQHKKVAVPKICADEMKFYYICGWEDLADGYYGILEPISIKELDCENPLVIMPGAVFDRHCNRIGYGKGYYDKFLSRHTLCKTIALAFELQMVEEIPCERYDIRPQQLITEETIYDATVTE